MLTEMKISKAEAAITPNDKPRTVEKMNWDLIRDPNKAGANNIVVTWLGQ